MTNRQESQGTKFLVQSVDLPAGATIASATQAKPCVLTMSAAPPAGFVVGAIVVPNGTGWKSLDDRPFQISAVSGMTVTLNDSDTSGETAAIATGGTAAPVTFTEACMATLAFTSPQGTNVDLTTMCDTARVTKPGLPALSTWQATGFWDATEATQRRLRDLFRSREVVVFEALWPDGSGLVFSGYVGSFDIRAGVDQPVAITVGGTMSGAVAFVDPPGGVGGLAVAAE